MDGPPGAGSRARVLQAKGRETEWTSAVPRRAGAGDPGRGNPVKPVGAVGAAAKVLRTLHASERPLHASEVARAAGLHCGTAHNILCTLYAEDFIGYDEATRSYSVSRAAELRHAIGGGAAFRERAIAASRVMSSMTRLRGRQHGWIASGSRQNCN